MERLHEGGSVDRFCGGGCIREVQWKGSVERLHKGGSVGRFCGEVA